MRFRLALVAAALALALPASALAGHGLRLDHPAAPFVPQGPPSPAFNSGGPGAKWERIATFATGNPHTDLDFFTKGGNTYASVGTLAVGPNAGGQTIFQMTQGNRVAPKFVSSHPSASCISEPAAALSLQHDVEATPKGGAILNTDVLAARRTDTQLLVDATDAPGRCHDQGVLGVAEAPQGGLEILDVADVGNPAVIGMTSHVGEAHTVNIDPKRPHIAYAVTSDNVTVSADNRRQNEVDDSGDEFDLDGFEVVDLSSCMDFPAGTTVEQKRARCKPQVFRYRFPSLAMAQGHTNKTGPNGVFGCHELEVYPDDRLTCGSGNAMVMLDMKGAFDDRGTPRDFRDDRPRGAPLPCRERGSTSTPGFQTAARVIDCVDGAGAGPEDLAVPEWLAGGAPSLQGVRWLGSAFHQGREVTQSSATPDFDSTQDIDFDHEAELSNSGRFVLATDERGGGVAPPGASCSPGADIKLGNGGLHAYRADRLLRRAPTSANDAFSSYARNSAGAKSIYRAPIRTQPQETICTSHVFQQIPGQNRIFMGWYSQGTQVVDFTEKADGTIDFKEAAYFIPENANTWVSHVFKVDRNANGSFTYYGATGDFNVGAGGRNAVDVYKVTLPPPPTPLGRLAGTGRGFAPKSCVPKRARITSRRIGPAKIGASSRRFSRRYRGVRRKGKLVRRGRVTAFCVKGGGRLYVGARKRKIDFLATTAKGHRSKRLRPGRRVRPVRVRGTRGVARSTYGTRRTKRGRVVYGVRGNRIRYVAVASKRASKTNVIVKRLRVLRLAPKAPRKRKR